MKKVIVFVTCLRKSVEQQCLVMVIEDYTDKLIVHCLRQIGSKIWSSLTGLKAVWKIMTLWLVDIALTKSHTTITIKCVLPQSVVWTKASMCSVHRWKDEKAVFAHTDVGWKDLQWQYLYVQQPALQRTLWITRFFKIAIYLCIRSLDHWDISLVFHEMIWASFMVVTRWCRRYFSCFTT